ncbi:hypothetical protein PMIN01_09808 [Paraphaeosphaeria minitans]|uniref:Uncharacterized protein n=1 Tax=Paraphaeosphaeria minitans TaxID=565426 RepID=A0A9P6GAL4_9PLEO|nr:hypothetical protein PMIN01_09808 [Paraphaeosphaeria minitans]
MVQQQRSTYKVIGTQGGRPRWLGCCGPVWRKFVVGMACERSAGLLVELVPSAEPRQRVVRPRSERKGSGRWAQQSYYRDRHASHRLPYFISTQLESLRSRFAAYIGPAGQAPACSAQSQFNVHINTREYGKAARPQPAFPLPSRYRGTAWLRVGIRLHSVRHQCVVEALAALQACVTSGGRSGLHRDYAASDLGNAPTGIDSDKRFRPAASVPRILLLQSLLALCESGLDKSREEPPWDVCSYLLSKDEGPQVPSEMSAPPSGAMPYHRGRLYAFRGPQRFRRRGNYPALTV